VGGPAKAAGVVRSKSKHPAKKAKPVAAKARGKTKSPVLEKKGKKAMAAKKGAKKGAKKAKKGAKKAKKK
jgi:hypothetical protein